MQLVIFNGGRVSTCRGCDRQTRHPHISIQLEVRRQEELNSCVQTSQQAWTQPPTHPPFLVQQCSLLQVRTPLKWENKNRFSSGTCFILNWRKDHVTYLKAEWNFQGPNAWSHGHMKWRRDEWMKSTSFYVHVKPISRPWSVKGYSPPWTSRNVREVVGERGKKKKNPDSERVCRWCAESHRATTFPQRRRVTKWKPLVMWLNERQTGDKGRD